MIKIIGLVERIDTKIDKDIIIEKNGVLNLHGMATREIEVRSGGLLSLYGMSNSINLEAGSLAYIHGTVNGDVSHKGGTLEIYGTINGELKSSNFDDVYVDEEASINNL